MKLPDDAIIAEDKIRCYLLVWRQRNDKSRWLASGGYFDENWRQLESDIRKLLQSSSAIFVKENRWGRLYEIKGVLNAPNGKTFPVCSYWMIEFEGGLTKFVTLYADKVQKS
ncbi:MAG: hypothetical protein GXP37_10875 [Chloroflexi bacterium]|nr:hypothetical protein [Chloroflexota bacterium]